MLQRLLLVCAICALASTAHGATPCTPAFPFNLINGTVADANQVMSNFNAVLTCSTTNMNGTGGAIAGTVSVALDSGEVGSGTIFAAGDSTNGGYVPNLTVPVESIVSAQGTKNGFVGQVLSNVPYATTPFLPVGTTGYGQVPNGTASVAFGLYGLGEIFNSLGEAVGGEVTVRNFSGGNASTSAPPPTGSPSSNLIADGFHITCGSQGIGEKDCSTGLYITNENGGSSSTLASFSNGIVINGYRQNGLFVASGYPTGSQVSAELDNNGNSLNLILKTTGTAAPTNAVFEIANNMGVVQASMFQNGDAHLNNVLVANGAALFVNSLQLATVTSSTNAVFGGDGSITNVVVGNGGTAAIWLSTAFTGSTCTNNGFMTIHDSGGVARKVMICS